MDNIIKFVNLEDSDVELVDQCIKDKKRIVTIQKKLSPLWTRSGSISTNSQEDCGFVMRSATGSARHTSTSR